MSTFSSFSFEHPSRLGAAVTRSLGARLAKASASNVDKTVGSHTVVEITGTQSPVALAHMFARNNFSSFNNLPSIVIFSSLDEAKRFKAALTFFLADFQVHLLDSFDVSPYMGLYPGPQIVRDRCRFFYWASRLQKNPILAGQHIFVATAQGLSQLAPPQDDFASRCWTFKSSDELPGNLAEFLNELGYQPAPLVEDRGQYSIRGGIVDIFSVANDKPVRIELFGDQIERLRSFSVETQLSGEEVELFHLSPAHEVNLSDDTIEDLIDQLNTQFKNRAVDPANKEDLLRSISQKNYLPGIEFALPFCFKKLISPLHYFKGQINVFIADPSESLRVVDQKWAELKNDFSTSLQSLYRPDPLLISAMPDQYLNLSPGQSGSHVLRFSNLAKPEEAEEFIEYSTSSLLEFSQISLHNTPGSSEWLAQVSKKLRGWVDDKNSVVVTLKSQTQLDRTKAFFAQMEIAFQLTKSIKDIGVNSSGLWNSGIYLLVTDFGETLSVHEEKLVLLRDSDFFGKKTRAKQESSFEEFNKVAKRLSFADLKPNDLVVHIKHGIGIYEGLKTMMIGGLESEFIQVAYKDRDKLYLPVYRVGQLQKYSGANQLAALDKLGGTTWEKTKIKVKGHLRDIASELLVLYAKRAEIQRPPLKFDEVATNIFERAFPFEETPDQLRAINEIHKDFSRPQPMDRLICGDVGFGKTEVAMRAAFESLRAGKQVAVLAPTTILSFQHFETFKKRFQNAPVLSAKGEQKEVVIRALNRFVDNSEIKKTLKGLAEGQVDMVIGTHRVFSKDVVFQDLGLLIIDEEQRFGVLHKEKIKKLKASVDTLTLSATPIPRTLNMSFTGVRDLSIINTAPVDRLPTRTFVSNPDTELIRKAILAEMNRGGQVYFIHNRVQSIYGVVDELRQVVPEARIRVGHGQMTEEELEETMLAFFNHDIDVLVCTTIVESGMDVPRANTMFIDQAHMFGLSQLYQLRGRVGRSKARAYCYLLLPKGKKLEKDAQERLKIIQENSALGSGIKIAQYDLELRGAGNILGDDQSGHVNSVGYELYMDLLNEALAEAKGEIAPDLELDPEINLRIPALIPDSYISDLRIRLSYYKALAEIRSQEDLDQIELELRDQFGDPPEPVVNLMGVMLIRRQCKDLGVRDISAGPKSISLIFTPQTKMRPEQAIALALRENKKYSLTPDQRLNVRMNVISWTKVFEELTYLLDYAERRK